MDLAATGSILDGVSTSTAANVTGPDVTLNAGSGSIGLTADALRIDAGAVAGALNASTQTGINLLQGAERAAFESHADSCLNCAPLLSTVRSLVGELHATHQVEEPPRLVRLHAVGELRMRHPAGGQ